MFLCRPSPVLLAALLCCSFAAADEGQKDTSKEELERARLEVKLLKRLLEEREKRVEYLQAQAQAQQQALQARIAALDKERQQLKEEVARLQKDLLKRADRSEAATTEAVRVRDEARLLQQKLEVAQVERLVVTQRAEQLTKRVRELEAELARLLPPKVPGDAPRAVDKNPPVEFVKGIVSDIDPVDAMLVRISIGSDAGLQKGNTLEVYRLKPQPVYVGTLRIMDLNARSAVGRLQGRPGPAGAVKVGDEVASAIK